MQYAEIIKTEALYNKWFDCHTLQYVVVTLWTHLSWDDGERKRKETQSQLHINHEQPADLIIDMTPFLCKDCTPLPFYFTMTLMKIKKQKPWKNMSWILCMTIGILNASWHRFMNNSTPVQTRGKSSSTYIDVMD